MTGEEKKEMEVEVTTLYFRKDGKTFDMRFKSNQEFAKLLKKSWFDRFMQGIANRLGATSFTFGGRLRWDYYLNPIWHIQQWWWLRKPTQIYGSEKLNSKEGKE